MNPMLRSLLPFCLLLCISVPGSATPITSAGDRLSDFLTGMHVESHWIAGQAIYWFTGDFDPNPNARQQATHCSTFAASVCARLGVYIPRPPKHRQTLLSNVQYHWLAGKGGADYGWRRLPGGREAQAAADKGALVVASVDDPNPKKPGHIAVVRPSDKSDADIVRDGPDIIQAGTHNWNRTVARKGFAGHKPAFRDGLIAYYEHDISL
jgi:hypothetical protein